MTLFDLPEEPETKREKKPKLGRYERVMKLLQEERDPYKVFVDFDDQCPSEKHFKFIDLFSGAGGMTLGFSNAGFEPVASVEVVPVASATHERNFPTCKHFCGEIKDFSPKKWLGNNLDSIHLVVGGPPCQGF